MPCCCQCSRAVSARLIHWLSAASLLLSACSSAPLRQNKGPASTKRRVAVCCGCSQNASKAAMASASSVANTLWLPSDTLCTPRCFKAAATISPWLWVSTSTAMSPACSGCCLSLRLPESPWPMAAAISSAHQLAARWRSWSLLGRVSLPPVSRSVCSCSQRMWMAAAAGASWLSARSAATAV